MGHVSLWINHTALLAASCLETRRRICYIYSINYTVTYTLSSMPEKEIFYHEDSGRKFLACVKGNTGKRSCLLLSHYRYVSFTETALLSLSVLLPISVGIPNLLAITEMPIGALFSRKQQPCTLCCDVHLCEHVTVCTRQSKSDRERERVWRDHLSCDLDIT